MINKYRIGFMLDNGEYQMKRRSINAALLTSIFLLQGCGGSSDSKDEITRIGAFWSTPVINMDYRTTNNDGVITRDYLVDPAYKTNDNGEYEYTAGETITFAIGDLKFPPVQVAETITPLDIAGTTDLNDREVVNIVRLLQTLDEDGDSSNGITITDVAKSVASPIDSFDIPEDEFATAVDALIKNGGQETVPTELVSAAQAVAYFEESLSGTTGATSGSLKGSWESSAKKVILHFLPDGRYLAMQWEQENGTEGFEYGTYVASNGNVTFTTKENNDGDALICDESKDVLCGFDGIPAKTFSYSVTDNELTLSSPEGTFTINRVEATDSPVDGLWEYLNEKILVTFIGGSRFFVVDYLAQDISEPILELGSYNLETNEDGSSVIEFSTSRSYTETGLDCEQTGDSPCDEYVDAYSIVNGQLAIISTDPEDMDGRAYLNSIFGNNSPANTAQLVAQKDYSRDVADNDSYNVAIEDDYRTRISTPGIGQASDLAASTVSAKFNIDETSTIVQAAGSNSRLEARLYAEYKHSNDGLSVEPSLRLRTSGDTITAAYVVATCFDLGCGDELSLEGSSAYSGNFTGDHEMKITWDSTAEAFVFLVDQVEVGRIAMSEYNADSRVIDAGGYTFSPADYTGASVNAEVRNIEAGGSGYLEVHVDEVSIDGNVYDDFTAGLIDDTKWRYESMDF